MKKKFKRFILSLSPLEVEALFSVTGAANENGDHEDWLRSAGGKPSEIRALRSVMRKTSALMKELGAWEREIRR